MLRWLCSERLKRVTGLELRLQGESEASAAARRRSAELRRDTVEAMLLEEIVVEELSRWQRSDSVSGKGQSVQRREGPEAFWELPGGFRASFGRFEAVLSRFEALFEPDSPRFAMGKPLAQGQGRVFHGGRRARLGCRHSGAGDACGAMITYDIHIDSHDTM